MMNLKKWNRLKEKMVLDMFELVKSKNVELRELKDGIKQRSKIESEIDKKYVELLKEYMLNNSITKDIALDLISNSILTLKRATFAQFAEDFVKHTVKGIKDLWSKDQEEEFDLIYFAETRGVEPEILREYIAEKWNCESVFANTIKQVVESNNFAEHSNKNVRKVDIQLTLDNHKLLACERELATRLNKFSERLHTANARIQAINRGCGIKKSRKEDVKEQKDIIAKIHNDAYKLAKRYKMNKNQLILLWSREGKVPSSSLGQLYKHLFVLEYEHSAAIEDAEVKRIANKMDKNWEIVRDYIANNKQARELYLSGKPLSELLVSLDFKDRLVELDKQGECIGNYVPVEIEISDNDERDDAVKSIYNIKPTKDEERKKIIEEFVKELI